MVITPFIRKTDIRELEEPTPFRKKSKDRPISIALGYRLDGRGSTPGRRRFFSSPQHPDQLWGSPSLLSDKYWGLFPQG
jgi:hypothetical protein